MKKLLITGANGFLGNYFSSYFNDYEITKLKSSDLDLSSSKLVNDFFSGKHFDIVLNCAAKGRYNAMSTDIDILSTNISIFLNLYNNKDKFEKLVNIGSGAEFGLTNNISHVKEQELENIICKEAYGLSKNLITRMIKPVPNFYNVRLFGCFDVSEPSGRLISGFKEKFKKEGKFQLTNDRYADYVSVNDIALVLQRVFEGRIIEKDINVVYKEKYKLSEFLKKFCEVHRVDSSSIEVVSSTEKNYTGNSEILDRYDIPLLGLERSFKEYPYE
jgi:dTDP-4-dehydrorhamnose reductase